MKSIICSGAEVALKSSAMLKEFLLRSNFKKPDHIGFNDDGLVCATWGDSPDKFVITFKWYESHLFDNKLDITVFYQGVNRVMFNVVMGMDDAIDFLKRMPNKRLLITLVTIDITEVLKDHIGKWVILSKDKTKILYADEDIEKLKDKIQFGYIMHVSDSTIDVL